MAKSRFASWHPDVQTLGTPVTIGLFLALDKFILCKFHSANQAAPQMWPWDPGQALAPLFEQAMHQAGAIIT